jgi:Zn finger protein HypA/HybF involved in hydrogenase expression
MRTTDDDILACPECGSEKVTVTAEQSFMVNTGEHYCHSVKTHDDEAKAQCLDCQWTGHRGALVPRA